jgi:hypothetical protein
LNKLRRIERRWCRGESPKGSPKAAPEGKIKVNKKET